MATYADMEELIRLGAYRAGSSAEVDEAIGLHQPLEAFLAQGKDEATRLAEGYQRLQQILGERWKPKTNIVLAHSPDIAVLTPRVTGPLALARLVAA